MNLSSFKTGAIANFAILTTLLTSSFSTFAAGVVSYEYERLLQETATKGYTRVLIGLPDAISLKQMQETPAEARDRTASQAAVLRKELGTRAFDGGYWNNGIGQIGLYVTADGLKALRASSNARTFMADVTHRMRDTAYGGDGSLKSIESMLISSQFADVEIFVNLDNADYDLTKDGRTVFRAMASVPAAVSERAQILSTMSWARGMTAVDTSPTARFSPSFTARVDKNAFFGLRESIDVRAIRPLGFSDQRPGRWDQAALTAAQDRGYADVILALRGGSIFSPMTGYMSDVATARQTAANDRALDELLLAAGVDQTVVLNRYSDTGSAYLKLSSSGLTRLYANADPRVLSVDLNKPSAQPTLKNSTVLMNVGPTWAAGFIGTGQYVIVYDSGILKTHTMLQMSGSSKVVAEYCYGSNSLGYASICPSPNGSGDSPANTAGAGAPIANSTYCAANIGICWHGTHVAGIATGIPKTTTSPTASTPGLAQGAYVVSAQVFSLNTTTNKITAFSADLAQALTDGYANTVSGLNNPYTVNMSLGDSLPIDADCAYKDATVAAKITQLKSRGIPVVVATGNNSELNGISWPACNPDTIKVSSVGNDSVGTILSSFANIGTPANYTGPILLAPGGNGGSSPNYVVSSVTTTNTTSGVPSTLATWGIGGTSQAAPHVSGIYAMLKAASLGISVADATGWIVDQASIAVTYNVGIPATPQTYRRIKLPN